MTISPFSDTGTILERWYVLCYKVNLVGLQTYYKGIIKLINLNGIKHSYLFTFRSFHCY